MTCQPGTPPIVTDDGVSLHGMTVVMRSATSWSTRQTTATCDNGQFCDGAETCDALNDCQTGAPPVVDDGVSCTTASCDEVNDGVVSTPDDGACDNGQFCDGAETCDPTNDCQSGSAPCQSGESCSEVFDVCGECLADADCDNGQTFATVSRPAMNGQ